MPTFRSFFSSKSMDSKRIFNTDDLPDDTEEEPRTPTSFGFLSSSTTSAQIPSSPPQSDHLTVHGQQKQRPRGSSSSSTTTTTINNNNSNNPSNHSQTTKGIPLSQFVAQNLDDVPHTTKKNFNLITEFDSQVATSKQHSTMSLENDIESNQSNHANTLQVPKPPFSSFQDIGFAEDMNPRHRRTNEDGHCMIDRFRGKEGEGFFAIYDGHGGRGAVNIVQSRFHNIFESELNDMENSQQSELIDVTQVYNQAYSRMDAELKLQEILYNGATSITCYVRPLPSSKKRFLYVANCGDARVVISKKDGTAERLTYDHKASDEGEVKRIKAKNGFVAYNRVNGVLSVTRSFGDHAMKEWVISEPYHSFVDLTENEYDYLILACDGVWDVISDQDCVNLIHENANTMNCQQLAEFILKRSLSLGSTDNISIIIIKL
ncbi:hypothetical protein C9374_007253 [Naegleria lovaniensis]|uniref:PPM-type phosphatase domain-containing protein n=1 Tax=Naegleria lovaniensis TaxID=51637 RepID=A0AA88H760_NAELO|nr:uncharacterized protein C9374_007253 [Naegleria lovaniensis]KAG2393722.1 hypothetical protein C9374_007253 [Naegleria lovaniensis]